MKSKIKFLISLLLVVAIISACASNKSSPTQNEVADAESQASSNEENSQDKEEVSKDNGSGKYIFRKVNFNMSQAEVMKSEDMEPMYISDETVVYDTTIAGLDCYLLYYFVNNKLVGAIVDNQEKHTSDERYIDDYNSMKERLTSKYGQPSSDNEKWDTNDHKSYYADKKGKAVAYEFLTLTTIYDTDDMKIIMTLKGDNYNISHSIGYYFDKNLENYTKSQDSEYESQF